MKFFLLLFFAGRRGRGCNCSPLGASEDYVARSNMDVTSQPISHAMCYDMLGLFIFSAIHSPATLTRTIYIPKIPARFTLVCNGWIRACALETIKDRKEDGDEGESAQGMNCMCVNTPSTI
ncbi:hypothetical protein B0T17DRAFT_177587 [Bombardia bombarda]|uniref:Secreted protein n=1 Tax=Bombardia bombarda TaxID=252184 RepID=A0AA40C926_9PEZI|nr:hypothetical protein B0T17DRAFT_177587 [Bombardia bombarda]